MTAAPSATALLLLAVVTVAFMFTLIRDSRSVAAADSPRRLQTGLLRFFSLLVGAGLLAVVGWSTWTTGLRAYTREAEAIHGVRVPSLPPPRFEPTDSRVELSSGRALLHLALVEGFRSPGTGDESFRLLALRQWEIRWPEARDRELTATFDLADTRLESKFAPRHFYRYHDDQEFSVQMNDMHFRYLVGERVVAAGRSSPGYLDQRIRRVHTVQRIRRRPVLSLVRDAPVGVLEVYGFLRVLREEDAPATVAARDFLEEIGFFDRVRAAKRRWPGRGSGNSPAEVEAGIVPFLVRTELAGALLMVAAIALGAASRRRYAGAVLAVLLVVLWAVVIDGALVRHHHEVLARPEGTPADRAIARSGLDQSFFFRGE